MVPPIGVEPWKASSFKVVLIQAPISRACISINTSPSLGALEIPQ
ncbi:MAG: hypothetical protein CM15mP109_09670 [Candidatus Dadabacteria bacterium]|nr:MAG: hypothetical protein CM15mP109_09670 [Candidatus Dadabacteria bacterium]